MRRVAVLVASRANYSRLKSVLRAIAAHPALELQLIVAASALLDRFGCVDLIERDGFSIDERLSCVLDGDAPHLMAHTTGLLTIELSQTFYRLSPDVVVVHADRYEMLAAATAAAYANILLAHTEGGERTGSIDDKVRWAITSLADLHLPVTQQAATALVVAGIPHGTVHVVGSPALDEIADLPPGPLPLTAGVGAEIDTSQPYLVVLQHPVTTEFGDAERQIKATVDAVRQLCMPTVWLWPNVDAGTDAISGALRRFREQDAPNYIRWVKTLPPAEFGHLLRDSACLIGNTSAGIKEGAFLGVPYVCVGSRQGGREHGGNVRFVECEAAAIEAAARAWLSAPRPAQDQRFGNGHAGEQVAEILAVTACAPLASYPLAAVRKAYPARHLSTSAVSR